MEIDTGFDTTAETTDDATSAKSGSTPENAAALYASGCTVSEIAKIMGIPYSRARKFIALAGTPIRDASARLKGRKRTKTDA